MTGKKKKALEADGWKIGTAAEFVGLTTDEKVAVIIPNFKVVSAANLREHYFVKMKRHQAEKELVQAELHTVSAKWKKELRAAQHVHVRLTRCATRALDDDNLKSGFKAARDEIASWLGKDDKVGSGLTWEYKEHKTKSKAYSVVIEMGVPGEWSLSDEVRAERERAGLLVRQRLMYASQRAVSWHEAHDTMMAILNGDQPEKK